MINLAGNKDCNKIIREELELAGIPITELGFIINSEVPASVIGELNGWIFKRAWRYWVANSHESNLLLFRYADLLHEKHGEEVRVAGHAGCLAPREWCNHSWSLGVGLYHIDSQIGLKYLADAIKQQAEEMPFGEPKKEGA